MKHEKNWKICRAAARRPLELAQCSHVTWPVLFPSAPPTIRWIKMSLNTWEISMKQLEFLVAMATPRHIKYLFRNYVTQIRGEKIPRRGTEEDEKSSDRDIWSACAGVLLLLHLLLLLRLLPSTSSATAAATQEDPSSFASLLSSSGGKRVHNRGLSPSSLSPPAPPPPPSSYLLPPTSYLLPPPALKIIINWISGCRLVCFQAIDWSRQPRFFGDCWRDVAARGLARSSRIPRTSSRVLVVAGAKG